MQFNQYKYDSLDGFIKANEQCFIILPSVHKMNITKSGTQAAPNGSASNLGEMLIKANVLPLNYEFS